MSEKEESAAFYKNLGNKLNQFVYGMGPSRGNKLRELSSDTLNLVIRFLSDYHVGLININESMADSSDLSIAAVMATSLISTADRRAAGEWKKTGGAEYMGARYADENMLNLLPENLLMKQEQIISCVYLEIYPTTDAFLKEVMVRFVTYLPSLSEGKHGRKDRNITFDTWQGVGIIVPKRDTILILRDAKSSHSNIVLAQGSNVKSSAPERMMMYTLFDRDYSQLINMTRSHGEDITGVGARESLKAYKNSLQRYGFNSGISHLILIPKPLNLPDIKNHVIKYFKSNKEEIEVIKLHQRPSISKLEIASFKYQMDNTEKLFEYIKDGGIGQIEELIHIGARLDKIDPESGNNALHMLAGIGWRPGIRAALKHPDRCDFTAVDRDGNLERRT